MVLEQLYVGIDLGTTNSSVAILNPYTDKVDVQHVDVGETPELIRSILSKDMEGNWIIGNQAAAMDQLKHRSVFSIKTQLRKDLNYNLTIDDETYGVEELVYIFLRELIHKAGIPGPEHIARLCLSVPVNMNEDQKGVMERAALRLGIPAESVWFIDEPVSVLWDTRKIKGQYVLVFDFGGGTLDLAIMDKYETEDQQDEELEETAETLEHGVNHYKGKVLAKVGLDLGGDDLDDVIIRAMVEEGKKQGNPVCESIDLSIFDDAERLHKLKNHPKFTFYYQLKNHAEKIKHHLSTEEQVTVQIPPLVPGVDQGIQGFKMTLEDFIIRTAAIRNRMLQGLKTLNIEFRQRTGLTHTQIEAVLLSGGSSLVSFVPDLLEELYNNARIVWDENFLQTRIARGNARYTKSEKDLLVGDVVNASYGIYNHAGKETIVVIQDTEFYPIQKVKRVATTKANQKSIEIMPMVKKGTQSKFESLTKNGNPLRWKMTIQPHPQTMDLGRISVTYEINKSQRLRISAYDHLFNTEIGIEEIALSD
jgi:molecular chaperone DnaK